MSRGDQPSVCVDSASHCPEAKALENPENTKPLSAAWNQVLQLNMHEPRKSERWTWLHLLASWEVQASATYLPLEALLSAGRSDESTKFENSDSNEAQNPMMSHKWKEKHLQNTYLIKDLYSNYIKNYRTGLPWWRSG